MRVGLFGDVHANLVALDAVLQALEDDRLDTIVCLGDIAITGPHPHEVMERIRALGCPVTLGNWDDWTLAVREGRRSYDGCRPVDRWCAEQLTAGDLAFMRTFQQTVPVDLDAITTLLCFHGSPRDYAEAITSGTSWEEVDQLLEGRRAGVLTAGHTHISMLRHHGQALVINPGSVSENWDLSGYPTATGEAGALRFNPWAEYAVLDCDSGRIGVSFRRVPIDVDAVIAAAHERNMPGAQRWSAQWVRS